MQVTTTITVKFPDNTISLNREQAEDLYKLLGCELNKEPAKPQLSLGVYPNAPIYTNR